MQSSAYLLLYKCLKWATVLLALVWVSDNLYDHFFVQRIAGDIAYAAGNTLFEDGHYERALREYEQALRDNPQHIQALRGKALSLLQLGRYPEALIAFNQAMENDPNFVGDYANRGIVYDRMGQHQAALADYENALQLDARLSEGPGWLTRFLRLQPDKPPTIADRARYLREQLAKPEQERVLRNPAIDDKQRPYKL